jgi:cysteine-rich repeat protein
MKAAVLLLLAGMLAAPARAQLLADSASVAGDSIARAFDADTSLCTYTDQPSRSFAAGVDHGGAFCGSGGDGTFSHAERLECSKGDDISSVNDAESGAKIDDFAEQAARMRTRFATLPGPHYVPVLLGHNDACTNVLDRSGNDCSGDRDPSNYCRTTAEAFERHVRLGLDELIQIPGVRVLVLALIRISQLCNFDDKNGCGALFALECGDVWQTGGVLEDIFGSGGICTSLTSDCSDQRQIDMYETLVAYNEVLERVTTEYAAIPPGGLSANGAVRAADVALRYSDVTFNYRFQSDDLSCCDCFHPSDFGQRKLAQFTWHGLVCSEENPCCAAEGSDSAQARCAALDVTGVHPSGFWANGVVCGNGIIDPGESCDDGNSTDGDECPASCGVAGGGTPTPTPSVTGSIAAGTPTATPTPTPSSAISPSPATATPTGMPAACAGDCGNDGTVTVDELVTAVNIALTLQPVTQCTAADANADGAVTIDELVRAVGHLLGGCV